MGYIVLEGGAEFGGMMAEPDRRALELAGGLDCRVSIIPTAAAPDKNDRRAGGNGKRWFEKLGATNVSVLPLVDNASADDPEITDALLQSQLIYILGGFTHYLAQTLKGSRSFEAITKVFEENAVISGSSAGAMVLCEHYYHHKDDSVENGLNFIEGACVLPHHDTFGKSWAPRLETLLPGSILTGIDEQTGMINDGAEGRWQVYGGGKVTLYQAGRKKSYGPEEVFELYT
jgi:cyanophycinase